MNIARTNTLLAGLAVAALKQTADHRYGAVGFDRPASR